MNREAVGTTALLFAVLASTTNGLNAFFEIDGTAWEVARFAVSACFTVTGLIWVAMTLRDRRSAPENDQA